MYNPHGVCTNIHKIYKSDTNPCNGTLYFPASQCGGKPCIHTPSTWLAIFCVAEYVCVYVYVCM